MLINNPLSILTYLCSLDKYQIAKNTACKHCIAMILYSKSCCVLEVKEFSLTILAKNYYNTIRKIVFNKNKLKIINSLLIVL